MFSKTNAPLIASGAQCNEQNILQIEQSTSVIYIVLLHLLKELFSYK